MRVLYVCSDFGIAPGGTKGASIHLRAITGALASLGHEVNLLSPKGSLGAGHPAQSVLADGCPTVERTCKRLKRWLQNRSLDASIARELRPLLYNEWVASEAHATVAEAVPDVIVERLSLLSHVARDLADTLQVPLVLEVNAPISSEALAFRSLQLTGLAEEIEQRVLQRADGVIAVSRPLADLLERRGVDPARLHVLPNGVHAEAFKGEESAGGFRAAHGLGEAFVVGFVGSLKPWHGVRLLLEAFAELHGTVPSARLLIVGDGPERTALTQAAAERGLEAAIVFTGAVPHDRVPAAIHAMDVAVAPFLDQPDFYFSPIKLFEYMAAGRCVVASKLGQIGEIIEDGSTGLLCPAGSASALAARLRDAEASPDLRRRLGAAARDRVRSQYTWEHTGRGTVEVLHAARRHHDAVRGGAAASAMPGIRSGACDEQVH